VNYVCMYLVINHISPDTGLGVDISLKYYKFTYTLLFFGEK